MSISSSLPVQSRDRFAVWFRSPRAYITLLAITLAFRLATALPLQQAGYMDASYSMHIAENVAAGRGLNEEVLWNYLDQPAGLPHPSHLYWMPLPSLLIAPFFALLGPSYRAAQIPFIVLSLFLPLFAFYLSRRMFARDDYAWAAGLFTAFSGFYTIYWVSPDNLTPFAVTASLCLYVIARGIETSLGRYFVAAGILAALSHLSRVDGLLLLTIPPIVLLLRRFSLRHCLLFTVYCLLSYLLVMSPWFARNYLAVGVLYPGGGTQTLWLTNYDEIFSYATPLTITRYLNWGIPAILQSKLEAGVLNFAVIMLGDLQVFLAPFSLIGLWQLRRRVEMLPWIIYAVMLYVAMTLVFTFPSMHGSMLHSATALLPFLAVAAPPGVASAVRWLARRRRTWDATRAASFFMLGFMGLALFFSGFMYMQGVFGSVLDANGNILLWNQRDAEYPLIAQWLDEHANSEDLIMTIDPPSFYNRSHRRAIMIPTDDITAVLAAARQYRARYLILEFDHPNPLGDLYRGRAVVPGLTRIAGFNDAAGRPVFLFQVTP